MPPSWCAAMPRSSPEMSADGSLRRIAVFGGGLVGLSAAAAFARALPRAMIELIATPADPAALADRLDATLPSIKAFNGRIGLTEADMIRRAGATHRLGTAFSGWSADGATWAHGFGLHGPRGVSGFHQHWLDARRAGETTPFHAHHCGAMLGLAERYEPPADDPDSPLSGFDYALRIDPAGYRAGLLALARHLQVPMSEGAVGDLDRGPDGRVEGVRLVDGRRIEADLFIDATGPGAALLSRLDDAVEDWAEALPCDRLLIGGDRPPALSLLDRVGAVDAGWWWQAPGRNRTGGGLAYAAALTPDDTAARALEAATGQAPAETIAIRTGRRPASWIGNVVAFGDAAVALDPLTGMSLHLAQTAILRAIELLPGRSCPPPVLREYNRRTADATGRARDFASLPYLRSGRTSGALWRAMQEREPPDSLAVTLGQFEERGRLPHFEDEPVERDDWLAVLIGLGIMPRRPDPAAGAMDEASRAAMLARSMERINAVVAAAPAYRDAYRRLAAS